MKTWIYSWIVYPLILTIAWIVGFFHKKTRDSLSLRSWKDFLSLRFNASEPIEYWVHVASSGELEYAMPILEELHQRKKKVIVTYYSISAKESVEKLPSQISSVSLVVPLPHDGLGLMKEFVSLCKKQGVRRLLIMKYELWPGLLWECNRTGIQVFLVNALKPSWFHKRLIHKLSAILTGYSFEVEPSLHPFVRVTGDSRVERVSKKMNAASQVLERYFDQATLEKIKQTEVYIEGSAWPEDDKVLFNALSNIKSSLKNSMTFFWVPHELEETKMKKAQKQLESMGFQTVVLRDEKTDFSKVDFSKSTAILVMKKGILVELYKLAWFAFVGGGFGGKIHSVWEPALAGCAVACGPNIFRSPESLDLIEQKILQSVGNESQLENWILEKRKEKKENRKPHIKQIAQKHLNASKNVVDFCEAFRN